MHCGRLGEEVFHTFCSLSLNRHPRCGIDVEVSGLIQGVFRWKLIERLLATLIDLPDEMHNCSRRPSWLYALVQVSHQFDQNLRSILHVQRDSRAAVYARHVRDERSLGNCHIWAPSWRVRRRRRRDEAGVSSPVRSPWRSHYSHSTALRFAFAKLSVVRHRRT